MRHIVQHLVARIDNRQQGISQVNGADGSLGGAVSGRLQVPQVD